MTKPDWCDHLDYRVAEKIIERNISVHLLEGTVYIGNNSPIRNCKFTFKGDILVGVELIDK